MCIDAPESTTNSASSELFEVDVVIFLTSTEVQNVALFVFLSM